MSDAARGNVAGADLIVTSLPPHLSGDHSSNHSADLVALYAARLLRIGGILVVLTHCDWTTGELTDPTGAVVTAGQNADLLYLQHIVVLHDPTRDGHFGRTNNAVKICWRHRGGGIPVNMVRRQYYFFFSPGWRDHHQPDMINRAIRLVNSVADAGGTAPRAR